MVEKKDGKVWQYEWNQAGMLAKVIRPDKNEVTFGYDALGRRIWKRYYNTITRWVWDGNKPLHEWKEHALTGDILSDTTVGADGVITWLFDEDSFAPVAKLKGDRKYSIIADHLGTPVQMFQEDGTLFWHGELDSYGRMRMERGEAGSCPFRYQGQYQDRETGLYYNRFRYYAPEEGMYVSQDPIRLLGGNQLYGYVSDPNGWVDVLGLSGYILGQNLLNSSKTHGINPFNRTDEWQAHHLIPEEVWGENKQFFKDIKLRGRDSANNGIFLPNSEALGNHYKFEFYHSGSHANYTDDVRSRVSVIRNDFRSGNIIALQAKQQIHDLQNDLYNRLNGRTGGVGCRRLS